MALAVVLGIAVNSNAADNLSVSPSEKSVRLATEMDGEELKKGIEEYGAENYEEALELLQKASEQQPGSSVVAFYLGLTYKQTGKYKEAAKRYRDALLFTPPVLDAYTELIEVLYNLNELKEAKEWIAKAEKNKIKPANIAFLKGLVLVKEGKNKDAINAFLKAKELAPSLSQSADFQIAMVHTKERRFAKARETLKALMNVDPTSELASFAKEYEKSIAKVLETYRTWRAAVGIAYQYDDNVLAKPSTAITGVDITGESDKSMINTFRIDYAPLISGQWSFNGQLNFYANTYSRIHTYNVMAPSLSLIPGYNFQDGMITVPLSYSHIWLREREYMSVTAAKPTLSVMLAPGHIGQFSMGYTKRELLQAPINSDEDRDGDIYSASAGYLYPFAGGKGMFNGRYEYSRDAADGVNWDNTGNRITLGLLVPLLDKLNLTASGDMLVQDYKNVHTAFGLKRKDKIYTGGLGLTYEILKDFNMNLQYSHTRADSNIAVYDYKRNAYIAGLELRF